MVTYTTTSPSAASKNASSSTFRAFYIILSCSPIYESIKGSAHVVRAEVYNTRNTWQDIKNWWKGLSLEMSRVCKDLRTLRTAISVSGAHSPEESITHVPIQVRCSNTSVSSKGEDTTLFEDGSKQVSSHTGMHPHKRRRTSSPLTTLSQLRTHSVVWKNFLWTPSPPHCLRLHTS